MKNRLVLEAVTYEAVRCKEAKHIIHVVIINLKTRHTLRRRLSLITEKLLINYIFKIFL